LAESHTQFHSSCLGNSDKNIAPIDLCEIIGIFLLLDWNLRLTSSSMMLTAMALHCFLHDNPKLILTFVNYKFFVSIKSVPLFSFFNQLFLLQVLAVIDLSLSSNIALSFSFNGLIDLGILGDTTCSFGVRALEYFSI
jgi:hypothetical protein